MLRPRRGIRKREGGFLDLSVRPCQAAAMMLAHVLLPGRNAEHLDKAIRSLCVPVQLPARRPGSESSPTKLIHRLQEGGLTLRRDGELERDQDGFQPVQLLSGATSVERLSLTRDPTLPEERKQPSGEDLRPAGPVGDGGVGGSRARPGDGRRLPVQ